MKKFVIVAFLGLCFINSYAEEGICSRTPQIQRSIIYQVEYNRTGRYNTGEPSITCEEVTDEELLDIKVLGRLHRDEKLTTLKPEDFKGLSNVRELQLRDNDLTEFPQGLEQLENLRWLNVGNNKLEGNIPENLGELLPNLSWADFGGNQLTGTIPRSLLEECDLERLVVNGNQLSGNIPELLGNCKDLQVLGLANNNFDGSIPENLSNADDLVLLNMGGNQLSGAIPESLGNLGKLEELNMSDNQLTGNIPESFRKLRRLTHLNVDNNPLTGEIPDILGNLENLVSLILPNRNPPESRNLNCTELNMDESNTEEINGFRFNTNVLVDALEDSFNSLYSDSPYVFDRPLERLMYSFPITSTLRELLSFMLGPPSSPSIHVVLHGKYRNRDVSVGCQLRVYDTNIKFRECERYYLDNHTSTGILVVGSESKAPDGSWTSFRPGGKSFSRSHRDTCTMRIMDTTTPESISADANINQSDRSSLPEREESPREASSSVGLYKHRGPLG